MFPLGTVLFPHAILPLHIFEPRYRAMMRDVLEGDQEFGVVLIERGSEVGGGDVRFGVGTMAHIVQASELSDGRFALAAVGVQRFRVERWLPDDPYPRADVVELVEPPPATDLHAAVGPVVSALRAVYELAARLQGTDAQPEIDVSPDPEQASHEIAALASLGPLDAQRVLELPDTEARLRTLGALLSEHAAMLRARLDEA
ncbi:MAG: ATP-dependent Lon protease [Actinomycetota bacterium]|nr:ATP-dependent Lon protease [Actinomycetota bacterium]